MEILVWTLAGAFAALLAHTLFAPRALSESGSALTGALAGLLGGCVLAPTFGLTDRGQINVAGLVVVLVCAVVALSIVDQHREEA